MRKNKVFFLLVSIIFFSFLFVIPAFAKDRMITTISIDISGNANAGELVNHEEALKISVVEAGYAYDFYEMTNKNEKWTEKDTPTMKIVLSAKEGYRFQTVKKGLTVRVEGATYKELKLTDGQYVCIVTVVLPAISDHAGPIESVTVKNRIAEWTPSACAGSYEVRLVRDDKPLGSIHKVTNRKFDATESMTKAGAYRYEVRGISKADGNSVTDWYSSPVFYVSVKEAIDQKAKNDAAQAPGVWEKSGDDWKFKLANGTYASSRWVDIQYKAYYFNGKGIMLKGWQQLKVPGYNEKQWVYLDPADGYLWKSATTPDGYYVNMDGVYKATQ